MPKMANDGPDYDYVWKVMKDSERFYVVRAPKLEMRINCEVLEEQVTRDNDDSSS